jgi:hypothetical protein
MSVENVPAVLNIRTLKGQFIAHKFSTGWAVEVVKSGKEEECCWPVCSQVKVRNVLQDSKTKQGRLRGRQVMGTSCCCKRVNTVEKQ